MLFDSLEFLIFLPTVIGLYYLLPHKFRWVLLLLASYFFYGSWKVEFLLLIMYSTIIDYIVAIQIEKSQLRIRKKLWLSLSLVSNFGLLFLFKYFNFFIGSRGFFQDFAGAHPKVEWMTQVLEYGIPVGISFYTFQTVGYTIDVYRGKVKAEKHIGKFALFVSYFPQLVAGPIERFSNLHNQIFAKHKLSYENLSKGFRLVVYGLFIKMVIADNIAPIVESVFENPLLYGQTDNIIALALFSLQIYADFHGYSLIAIGVAKILGVNLMDNFKTPYFASSIKDFWNRWHISLSTWFRDYLYIPLGGNKVRYFRWIINILIVFIVSGIWHGANFTFIVWGSIHGLMYLFEQVLSKANILQSKNRIMTSLGLIKTLFVINIAWLFFRSDSIAKAYLSLSKIFGFKAEESTYLSIRDLEKGKSHEGIENILSGSSFNLEALSLDKTLFIVISVLLVLELWIKKSRFDVKIDQFNMPLRWIIYGVLIYFIMAMSGANFYQFIYFQF